MIQFKLKQNTNEASSAFGKWYAYPSINQTMDLEALAEHMEDHNSGFSKAMCLGVMTAMVRCIKEQILEGKNVKIDNLAIFSAGIRNKVGADSEEDFTASANISGVKLRARATGTLSNANLNLAATLKKVSSGTSTSGTKTSTGKVTLTLAISDATMGTITPSAGKHTYANGSEVTISVNPNDGYSLAKWSDGDKTNPRTLTLTEDMSLTAEMQLGIAAGEV